MEGVGGVCNFSSILLSVTVSKLSDFTAASPALRIKWLFLYISFAYLEKLRGCSIVFEMNRPTLTVRLKNINRFYLPRAVNEFQR